MMDVHCHMLPAIDDGPDSMEESLSMARHAVEAGFSHVILTPHILPGAYDNDAAGIAKTFAEFESELRANGIPLSISMAAEVRVCGELPEMIAADTVPFLGLWQGRRALLLEWPFDAAPIGFERLIAWLLARDIVPVVAHPERNKDIILNPEKIGHYVQLGCLFQITGSSVTGLFGKASQACALFLLYRDWVAFIATDAHNMHKRSPSLVDARRMLQALIGIPNTRRLFDNAHGLIPTGFTSLGLIK